MRILHVIFTYDFGGSERYAAELARAQAEAGHDVRILVRPQPKKGPSIVDALPSDVSVAFVSRWGQKWHIRKHIDFFKPDIIHTHLGKASRLLGRMHTSCPVIATLHLEYKAKNYAHHDGLIAINHSQSDAARKQGFSNEIREIYNWGTLSGLATSEDINLRRELIQADDNTFVFGTIARLHQVKGIAEIIVAFQAVGDESLRLVIVGSGEEEAHLKALAGPDQRIYFIPHTPHVAAWYGAIDTFISAAHYEPFGLTLVEAMQAGCPIIATETEGARLVLKNQFVRFVPPKSTLALVEEMSGLLGHERQRQSYNLENFEKQTQVKKIEDFYQELLPKPL